MSIKFTEIECTQNRKSGEESIAALAESIKAASLINPITLKVGKKGYTVIAGRRRFAALQLLGRTELADGEYRIIESDAAMVSFTENHHRENLTIAEELKELEALQKASKNPKTAVELAQILGRTPQYIALRLQLSKLIPDFKKILDAHAENPGWTVPMLEIVSREVDEVQEELYEQFRWRAPKSKQGLLDLIGKYHCTMDSAIFDTSKCVKCECRSSNQDVLFAEYAETDQCLNTNCFKYKQAAFIAEKMKAIFADKESPIKYFIAEEKWDLPKAIKVYENKILREYEVKKTKGKANAMMVDGADAGKEICVKVNASSQAAADNAQAAPVKTEKTLEDREKELKAKRNKVAIAAFAEYIRMDECYEELTKSLAVHRKDKLTRLMIIYGIDASYEFRAARFKDGVAGALTKLPPVIEDRWYCARLWSSLAVSICQTLNADISGTLDCISDRNALFFAEFLQIDFARFWKKAATEIPEPKSLLKARAEAKEKAE